MKTSQAPVHRARSLPEALDLRSRFPDAKMVAGATDVMVELEAELNDPLAFIDLWSCGDLRGVSEDGRRIGALTTWTQVARSAAVPQALHECARTIGARQNQNRGTVGGNIVNASPAGDSLPLWLAWDASFEVASTRGTRTIPATAFYLAYRKVALEPDEILTAVVLPELAGARLGYRKVGTRLAQAISKVVMGTRATLASDGTLASVGVAFGSVGPVPLRATKLEAALVGQRPDPSLAAIVREDIAPIDDIRSTKAYRLQVTENLVASWLRSLAGAA